MIKVNIICVGRLKDAFFEEAAKEYIKMLGSFCQIKITEINAANLPREPSRAEIEKALMAEAKEILRKIPERSKTIALCIEGKQLSSEEFADLLEGCK
ncbi:MAG TPA: 23S rRNA (pseudouridine(1915)-N(3))-methyltransferase RlmH, partial [Clostridiales bacterium]|nr:23S rRNA (pseudouridine(1915)-N(3))-methyltransferase RlmH [Clostridiales bacterium]